MKNLLLGLCLLSSGAFASENFVDVGVGVTMAQSHEDFADEVENGIAGSLAYRHALSESWSLGLGLFSLNFEESDAHDQAAYLLARYNFNNNKSFRPYLNLGFGTAKVVLDSEFASDYERGSGLLGVGFNTAISESFAFDLGVNYHHISKRDEDLVGTEQNIIVAQVGLTYSWGSTAMTKAVEKVKEEAKEEMAPKIMDQDKDGVADDYDQCADTPYGTEVNVVGCAASKEMKDVKVDLDVKFNTGKATLKEESTMQLDKLASLMKANSTLMIEFLGHTDSTGSRAGNLAVSQRRAEAVKSYLVQKHGVDAARLTAKGLGPDFPVSTNDTAAGREENRRVEAKVLSNK